MSENLYLYKRLIEKEMFLNLLIFQSISVMVGSISIKQARSIDVCVRNLIGLLVNMMRTTATWETSIIKQPNVNY